MDINPLAELSEKWPADTVKVDISNPLKATFDMLASTGDPTYFLKFIQFDQSAQQAITQFAQINGLTYVPYDQSLVSLPAGSSSWKDLPGWLTSAAGSSSMVATHVVSGAIEGFDVTMFTTYWIVGDDKSAGMGYMRFERQGVIKVQLSKVFPQLVLDSNKNDNGRWSSVGTTFVRDQVINLEGDFPKYFDFYVPKGLQINGLSVLAPNFMQIVKDSAVSFDVEFYGDEMILLTKQPLYTKNTMESALVALREQLPYLERLLPSWSYAPTKLPLDTLMREALGGGYYKIGSKRISLKRMILIICILICSSILVPFVLLSLLFMVLG